MNPEDFNRSCAEYMGYTIFDRYYMDSDSTSNGEIKIFDYYGDANYRNKVIEKIRASTNCHYYDPSLWFCDWRDDDGEDQETDLLDSMEAAQIACITKVLEAL